jgi:hypothetical protein
LAVVAIIRQSPGVPSAAVEDVDQSPGRCQSRNSVASSVAAARSTCSGRPACERSKAAT